MAILLTLTESENQILAGIPEYVTLESSQPANIFYTLDGTTPDENSNIFVDILYMPTTGLKTVLKAIAISNNDMSSVLEITYAADVTDLDRTRLISKEGINVLPSGGTPIDNLAYDEDGNPAKESVIDFNDLDLIGSSRNRVGEQLGIDSTIDFIHFPIETGLLTKKEVSYTSDFDFNPKAKFIIIDGSTQEKKDEQVVNIINRPHNSMDMNSHQYEKLLSEQQLVTAHFVRYQISPKNGKITFYYVDSRDGRWVTSTQAIDFKGANLSARKASPPQSFVYRWVEHRSQSKLY